MSDVVIRPSTAEDLDAVTAIYAWNVAQGTGTFEIDAPDRTEMERCRADVLDKGLPWLVLEQAGRVVGYAYANQFRPRPAYRFCLKDSVYLAGDAIGRGFGRLLLAELLARREAAGARQMLAVIGDSANAGSIGVHRALGFAPVGTMQAAGWKFERWLDVVVMQKSLGHGAAAPAPALPA
ncbi:MAG: N-acetyltransferase family protein [Caldimonas sp.]